MKHFTFFNIRPNQLLVDIHKRLTCLLTTLLLLVACTVEQPPAEDAIQEKAQANAEQELVTTAAKKATSLEMALQNNRNVMAQASEQSLLESAKAQATQDELQLLKADEQRQQAAQSELK
jgi:hypothetical protein